MKPTIKADTLKKARGSFLGAPVSVTRDEDPKATRRISPEELNRLVDQGFEWSLAARTAMFLVGGVAALVAGALVERAHKPIPELPAPVRFVPTTVALVTPTEAPAAAPTVQHLLRTRAPAKHGIKEPLFAK